MIKLLKKLMKIQTSRGNYKYSSYKKTKNYQILKETKILHQKTKNLSRLQIIELSILFIILNYLEITSKKLEELSEIVFLSEKNESLKNTTVTLLSEGKDKKTIIEKIKMTYDKIIKEINENSNIQMIVKNKNEEDVVNLLDDLISDHKEQGNLRKLESLEKKLINNLDENSYLELIKLKSQLNRD